MPDEEQEDLKQLQKELLQGSNIFLVENLSRMKSFHTLDAELALQAILSNAKDA